MKLISGYFTLKHANYQMKIGGYFMKNKSKEIKFINYIILNGQRVPMSDLNDEQRKIIAVQLNDKAMAAIGYVCIDEIG